MTKGQTKFGRRYVNGCGSARCADRTPRRGVPTDERQRLSRRCFAVRKNCSYRRRKFINPCAWHDDAVTAAVSFLGDPQELAALIFPELDIKVLALNLQFFRLDDVIHFALRAPSLGCRRPKWKKNRRLFRRIS